MQNWPNQPGTIDLGGDRVLDATPIPIPGRDTAGFALYDRQIVLLFTGDTLYPDRLFVRKFSACVESVKRLVDFTKDRPVAHITGTHIEQSRTPFVDYNVRSVYQPGEVVLELQAALAARVSLP